MTNSSRETKEQLEKKLRQLEEEESEAKDEAKRQKNYREFLERDEDWVIGMAHADIGIQKDNYGWDRRGYSIGDAISIRGNCGTSYNALAFITSATHTYFHNVWTETQRRQFQEALNRVALKEVKKIMADPRCVLEIMGLQSTAFYLGELYPKDKVEEVKREVEKGQKLKLDEFSDKQLKDLVRTSAYRIDDGDVHEKTDVDLSHSKAILFKYVAENRPKLHKHFLEIERFKHYLPKSK